MWQNLRDWIGGLWDAQRHEEKFASGIPDVSFGAAGVGGWIELKVLPKWPALDKPVKIEHLTPQQKNWLWLRGNAAGRCWLLLKIQKEWLLFDHQTQRDIGKMTQMDMRKRARKVWTGLPPREDFLAAVTEFPATYFRSKF